MLILSVRAVPGLKQRMAGKSLPTEKFLTRKSRKYFEQGRRLLFPAHVSLNKCNAFELLSGRPNLSDADY